MPELLAPDECAQCGTAIPRGAAACPECGSDERTGWRERSIYDGLDLPDDAGDAPLPGATEPDRRWMNGFKWYWFVMAVLLLALLATWTIS